MSEELNKFQIYQEKNRARAKKHYDNKIANDKVEVNCKCGETHYPLRLTYEKNIKRNGEYICEKLGGKIAGSKPKLTLRKENPYALEGKKECNNPDCEKKILPFNCFSPDKTKRDGYSTWCKECRAKKNKAKYQENKNKEKQNDPQ